jgi:hypothetical protein
MTATIPAQAPAPSAPAGPRPWLEAVRLLRTEIRHSAFVWSLPLLIALFIYDPYRTAAGYPAIWPVRSTVVLNKFWPDMVIFAAGFSAWAGSREGRRHVGDLLASTARPAWTRQLCALVGTAFWVLAAFLAGVIVLYVRTSQQATWGGPPIAPVVVGVLGLVAVCSLAFTLGALFPGRFTAPIVAVALTIVTLWAFRQAVGDNGGGSGAIGVLSPDGGVPGNDWGLFYPVSIGVPIVQGAFMAGVALASVGVLGLASRTGGVGWRGALSGVAAGGARLRAIAGLAVAVGVALAVSAFVLAETANVADATSTLQIPVIDNALAGTKPIPYTPVCSSAGSFPVCLHPSFRGYLPQVTSALSAVAAELAGLPGTPTRATEVSQAALPSALVEGNGNGQVTDGVYRFTMTNAVALAADPGMLRDGLQQDIVHAVVVGSSGKLVTSTRPNGDTTTGLQQNNGTTAQQAVEDGLLRALGSKPYPVGGPQNGPGAQQFQQQQDEVTNAAAKFAALPAATRHAWLVANLTALKAGRITVAQIP